MKKAVQFTLALTITAASTLPALESARPGVVSAAVNLGVVWVFIVLSVAWTLFALSQRR